MTRGPRRSRSTVTISTVAQRAGVSAMTVSNVLTGAKPVQPATRAAVLKAAQDLNYAPSIAARTLAGAQEIRIGLLHGSVQHDFTGAVLVGALTAASRLGAQLMLRAWDLDDIDKTATALRALTHSGASALLLPAPICEQVSGTGLIEELGVPVIGLAPGAALIDMPSIKIDEYEAMRQMTLHLIARGHCRIGFIQGAAHHRSALARRDGFVAALEESGCDQDPGLRAQSDYTFQSGLAAAAVLLELNPRPTAIVCSNDDVAAGAMAMAHRLNLRIPEDLSITGFDDSPIATKLWPALTTVRQPIADMAGMAVETLISHLKPKNPREPQALPTPDTRYVDHEIIERGSVSAPPA